MKEKIIKTINYIFENDMFNPKGLSMFSTEEKLFIITNRAVNEFGNTLFNEFLDTLAKHKLSLFEENELHDYFSTRPFVHNSYWQLGSYISNAEDAKFLLTRFGYNIVPEHAEDFLVKVTKNINDTNLIVEMYYEMQKKEFPEERTYNRVFLNAIISLDNDKFKIGFLKNPFFKVSKEQKAELLSSLSSDQMKIDNISLISKKYITMIIASLESDELKANYLDKHWVLIKDKERAQIINGFKDKELASTFYQKLGSKGKTTYLTTNKTLKVTIDEVNGSIHGGFRSLNLINTLNNFTPDAIIYLVNNLKSIHARMIFANNVSTLFQKIYNQYGLSECLRVVDAILSKIPQAHIIHLLKEESNFEIVLHGLKYVSDTKGKVSVLVDGRYQDSINKSIIYDDKYLPLIKDFASYYQVPEDNLIMFVRNYDMLVLRFLFKKNFRNIMQLDRETLDNLLKLMKLEYANLDENTLNDIINGFVQRSFANKNRPIMSVFHDLLVAISEKNEKKIQELLNAISERISIQQSFDDIIKNASSTRVELVKKVYDGKHINYKEFIRLLLSEPEMTNILHEITNQYISFERSEYSKKETEIQRELVTKEVHNVNQMIKYVFVNNSEEEIFKAVKEELNNSIDELSTNERTILDNDELLRQLITFNKNPMLVRTKPDNRVIGVFYVFLKKRIGHMTRNLLYNSKVINSERKLYFSNPNESVLDVISELNPELLASGTFKNENALKLLTKYLNKYKMLGWGNRLEPLSGRADLLTSPPIIASFITYFEKIYAFAINNKKELLRKKYPNLSEDELSKKAEKLLTLTTLLDITVAFSTNFKSYEKIFGKEDFRIILSDPQPYKSKYTKMEKLEKTANLYVDMFKRTKVTVPASDKDYELKNGKKINIVVGNVTNPMNLDYGERTESCMRMGGFDDSLYRFAAVDKNGFHIRFVNPKNEELISRVTGFRNGNTIFLNELRLSLSDEYSNEDVVEACQLISKELVKSTSNSKYPIENVVISPYYCMANRTANRVNLHMLNITKGLGHITNDIGIQPILMATRSDSSHMSPISLGSDNVELYDLQRDKVRLLVRDDLIDSIQRIESMNQMLNGKSINEINTEFRQDLLVGYVGEDFYCAITLDGNIISNIMNARVDNKKTLNEFNAYLEKIEANREALFEGACERAV